jgi:HSP20 family protein
MTKKPKTKKKFSRDDFEEMKQEIAKKSEEIKQLQKSMEEMKTQIKGEESTGKAADVGKMVSDVSGLLDLGFGIFGSPGKTQGGKSQGLIGLIDELGKLAEKSQTTQKTVNLGKHGVATFSVSSHSIRGAQTPKPAGPLKIIKPNKAVTKPSTTITPATGTIKEREPIVDVFEEENCVRVTAELPGIQEDEISLKVDENALVIDAGATTGRAYHKKVELPTSVRKETIEHSCRNGILEVKLGKEKRRSQRIRSVHKSCKPD